MRNLLEEGTAVLDEVARERMLLAFDFDGTLAPIVDVPDHAAMRRTTRMLLRVAALLYPCAVVSGRARADLRPRLDGVPLLAVVGNHGAEAGFGPVRRSLRALVVGWREGLERCAREIPGLEIEDKGLSIAAHYRHAAAPLEARRALLEVAANLPGARAFGGHAVVNVVPAGAHHKGVAVSQLLPRAGCRRALFVGDDITDEDAFRCESVAVGVRVGRTHPSAASWYLPSQGDVDALLRALIRARRRQDGLEDDDPHVERLIHLVADGS